MLNKEYEQPWFSIDNYITDNRYGILKLNSLPLKWRNEFLSINEMWNTITIDIQYCINIYCLNFFDYVNFTNLNDKIKRMLKNCVFYTFTSILYGKLPTGSNVITTYSDNDGYNYNSSFKYDNRNYMDIFSPTALKSLQLTNIKTAMKLKNDPLLAAESLNSLDYNSVITENQLIEFENEVHAELDLIYKEIDLEIYNQFDLLKTNSEFINKFVVASEEPLEKKLAVNEKLNESLQKNALDNEKWNKQIESKIEIILDDDKTFIYSVDKATKELLEKDNKFIEEIANNKDMKDTLIKAIKNNISDLLNSQFSNLSNNYKIESLNNKSLIQRISELTIPGEIRTFGEVDIKELNDLGWKKMLFTNGLTLINKLNDNIEIGHESIGSITKHTHTASVVSDWNVNSRSAITVARDYWEARYQHYNGGEKILNWVSADSQSLDINQAINAVKITNSDYGANEYNMPAGLYVNYFIYDPNNEYDNKTGLKYGKLVEHIIEKDLPGGFWSSARTYHSNKTGVNISAKNDLGLDAIKNSDIWLSDDVTIHDKCIAIAKLKWPTIDWTQVQLKGATFKGDKEIYLMGSIPAFVLESIQTDGGEPGTITKGKYATTDGTALNVYLEFNWED